MTESTLRIEFRRFLDTTNLMRNEGMICAAGNMNPDKVEHTLVAVERLAREHNTGGNIGTTAREVGSRFWRYVAEVPGARDRWSYRLTDEYPHDRTTCEQIGEWLIAHRHLTTTVTDAAEPRRLSVGDPVWVRPHEVMGQVVSVGASRVRVTYREINGMRQRDVAFSQDDVTPLRDVDMVLRDGPRSGYEGDSPVNDGVRWRFDRWWSPDGLDRDQAVWMSRTDTGATRYIAAQRFIPASVIGDRGPETTTNLDARFLYRRSDGKIVWAQGWSANGRAFDAYERSREDQTGRNIGVGQYRDYAEFEPGTPIEMVNPGGSHGYAYAANPGDVTYFARFREQPRGNYAIGVHSDERRARQAESHGYVGVNHVRVKVETVTPTVAPESGDNVITVDGVEYVRKSVVDEDTATIARILHTGAEANGLCAVYDRVVGEANAATTLLNLGGRTRTRYVTVTETYTVRRVIEVPNTQSDDQARDMARRSPAINRPGGVQALDRTHIDIDSVRL